MFLMECLTPTQLWRKRTTLTLHQLLCNSATRMHQRAPHLAIPQQVINSHNNDKRQGLLRRHHKHSELLRNQTSTHHPGPQISHHQQLLLTRRLRICLLGMICRKGLPKHRLPGAVPLAQVLVPSAHPSRTNSHRNPRNPREQCPPTSPHPLDSVLRWQSHPRQEAQLFHRE
ncbi:hypothetical protein EMCG_09216 [[Emmonsia] crescens]|uniref:Uncharacterized protein n=1 Tax=[Emmonsia] crescens TaxID=73230 RepID=A0A0G2J3B0_9EURO|nr:hypothetical protein EMCG_09216 [Emmonsia crescens UAMH 3008]